MPSQSPSAELQAAKRRQLQERRRTLQTISELSATEPMHSDFRAAQVAIEGRMGAPYNGRKAINASKRRSLPKNYIKSEATLAPLTATLHSYSPNTQRTPPRSEVLRNSSPRHEAGWNARREQARIQAEQALSGINTPSTSNLRALNTSTPLIQKPSQPHLRSYHSHQHLLRSPRSSISSPPRSPQPPDFDIDSERTSTDSSSFHSSLESAMRGPRSSCSSQSFTLLGVPSLPTGCAQPMQPYYAALTSHYHAGYPYQLPGPMYGKGVAGGVTGKAVRRRESGYEQKYSGGGVVRPQSGSGSGSVRSIPACRAAPETQMARLSLQHGVEAQRYVPSRSRPRSRSSLKHKAPSQQQSPRPTQTVTFETLPTPHALSPPLKHTVPDRSRLTKWKAEREEGSVEAEDVHRARVAARVRRANEMEKEKERELQAVGKGAEKGARVLGMGLEREKERGCFAVVWRAVWGR